MPLPNPLREVCKAQGGRVIDNFCLEPSSLSVQRDQQHQEEFFPAWASWLAVLAVIVMVWAWGRRPKRG